MDDRLVVHVDIDAFFASVEQVLDPSLRGRPVIVCGGPEGRGAVASASYEARRFGVRAGMPLFRARELCPGGVFAGGSFEAYNDFSERVFEILSHVSPSVEKASLDEAYVDLRGCRLLYGIWSARPLSMLPFAREAEGVYRRWEGSAVPPARRVVLPERIRWAAGVGLRLKRTVRAETGLDVSVGIGPNRVVARAATGCCRPDGIVLVEPAAGERFLGMLALKDVPGVGRVTLQRLRKWNVHTVGQARRLPLQLLQDAFGPERGRWLFHLMRGAEPARGRWRPRSIGRETTFWIACSDYGLAESVLFRLTERLGRALRREGLQGRTVQLRLRYEHFAAVRAARSVGGGYTDCDEVIFGVARRLLRGRWRRSRRLRLIGVKLADLRPGGTFQGRLFDDRAERGRRLDRCLDGLRDRFGFDAVHRGLSIMLPRSTGPGCDPVTGEMPCGLLDSPCAPL